MHLAIEGGGTSSFHRHSTLTVAFAREQPYLPEALVNEIQPLLEPPGKDDPWPRRHARVTNDHAAAAGGNSPFVRDRRVKGRCARNCCRSVWPLRGRYRCGRDGGRARSFSQATRGWADVAGNLARGIAVNLLTTGHYFCVAARDMTTAFAAFTLARLTEAGAGAEARDHIGESGLIDRGTKVYA
jgi:hypothetical protein